MDALQRDFTCPHMRDQCNGNACPQIETCKHIQSPAEEEIQEGTLKAIVINLSEHWRIVAYLREQLEECEDVPQGIISTLSLLGDNMQNNAKSLCALQEKTQ